MLASELFAKSNQAECSGEDRCYWCSAPCKRLWPHGEPPPIPFVRSYTTAKVPCSGYICSGCWYWRRKRTTVFYLRGNGALKDGQTAAKHSWWVTVDEQYAIQLPQDAIALYERLLNPPKAFFLSLRDGEEYETLLQQGIANDNDTVKADTTLYFTINNIIHCYTVYELEAALRDKDPVGKEPGVRALIKLLGPYELLKHTEKEEEEEKRGRGRPKGLGQDSKDIKESKRVITK